MNDQPWVSDLTSGARDYASDGEGNLLYAIETGAEPKIDPEVE